MSRNKLLLLALLSYAKSNLEEINDAFSGSPFDDKITVENQKIDLFGEDELEKLDEWVRSTVQ